MYKLRNSLTPEALIKKAAMLNYNITVLVILVTYKVWDINCIFHMLRWDILA